MKQATHKITFDNESYIIVTDKERKKIVNSLGPIGFGYIVEELDQPIDYTNSLKRENSSFSSLVGIMFAKELVGKDLCWGEEFKGGDFDEVLYSSLKRNIEKGKTNEV